MAEGDTQVNIDEQESGSSGVQKILAAVVGLIMIILVVVFAFWLGNQIKEHFFPSSSTTTTTSTTTTGANTTTTTTKSNSYHTATYSAIPATGPNDTTYIVIALAALTGFSLLLASKKFSL